MAAKVLDTDSMSQVLGKMLSMDGPEWLTVSRDRTVEAQMIPEPSSLCRMVSTWDVHQLQPQ
jgi:hypothetical protein